jgi:uncharacterized protein (TIGR03437 family)
VTATAVPSADQLPNRIVGAGVQVLFANGTAARLLYVSPKQVNFLMPASFVAGNTTLTLVRDGLTGPAIPITIADVAPGLFQSNGMAAATHADGSLITAESPARAGEVIVLYGTGLGQTTAPLDWESDGRLVPLNSDLSAIRIQRFSELSVTLNGVAVDPWRIFWAGLTPGLAGVYQINLQLPEALDVDPEVRAALGGQSSAPGVKLATH